MRAKIIQAYKDRIATYQQTLDETQGRFLFISYARLGVFLAGGTGAYLLFGIDPLYGILCGAMGLVGFLYLVKIHSDIVARRDHLKRLIDINQREIEGLGGNRSVFDAGEEYINPQHAFSFDLDIFGKDSIFQLLNRTGTVLGRKRLVHELEFPIQEKNETLLRQEAISELGREIDWNLEFEASAKDQSESFDDTTAIRWWVDHPLVFSHRSIFKTLVWLLPLLLGISFLLWVMNYVLIGGKPILGDFRFPFFLPLSLFVLQLIIAGLNLSKTNEEHQQVSQKARMLKKYAVLLSLIEKKEFHSDLLREYQQYLQTEGKKASQAMEELAEIGYRMDQRMNMIMGLVLNGTLMWDLRQVLHLERWRSKYKHFLPAWFEQVAQWDALNSLGRFAYNHPEYIYPRLMEGEFSLKAREMGHPLLNPEVRVDNDITFEKPGEFIITTGANMAGKSTFLRTVGVNLVLGMLGLPVCARHYDFVPIELMSSVRITDSITENESFFYAELKRLKSIIDRLKEGNKPIFIIIDEMLRGTNSKDKTKGSKGFIEQLIHLRGVGLVATHDLALGKLAEEYPGFAFNKRFEVSISADKLSFDYKFQDGISQNLNATFLMEQMGIIEKQSSE